MQWSEAAESHLKELKPIDINQQVVEKVLQLLDLTSLNDTDSEDNIAPFLEKAFTSSGHVASVCVMPSLLRVAANQFSRTPVKVGTVANFPEGSSSLEHVLIEINSAIQNGAQEIDMVFPYQRYLAGENTYVHSFVNTCKAACGDDICLKVILETGILSDPVIIADATYDVLAAGADFVKTSTGKTSPGANLQAVVIMLLVIKHITPQLKRNLGIKVSGGIKNLNEAVQYIQLAENVMGHDWVSRHTFRIGASRLIDEIISFQS